MANRNYLIEDTSEFPSGFFGTNWRASNATYHRCTRASGSRRAVMACESLHPYAEPDQGHSQWSCCDCRGYLASEGIQPARVHHPVSSRTLKGRAMKALQSMLVNKPQVQRNMAEFCL